MFGNLKEQLFSHTTSHSIELVYHVLIDLFRAGFKYIQIYGIILPEILLNSTC